MTLSQLNGPGDAFRSRDAAAAGISRAQLRSGKFAHPFFDVYTRPSGLVLRDRFGTPLRPRESEHLRRALAFAKKMRPEWFFTHVTAAVIHGIPLPLTCLDSSEVDVGVMVGGRAPRAKGVRGHEVRPRLVSVRTDEATGLRVASPASTWALLGSVLHDGYDVVAAGDAVVRTWRIDEPLATLTELHAAVDAGRRVGVRALRDALPRIRTRSASRPESRLRLVLVDGGLPEPALNFAVVERGRKLGSVDGAYPDARVAIEYEGDQHLLSVQQWASDIERYEGLAAAGWLVVRITKIELFTHPDRVLRRVRAALASRSSFN